MPYRLRLNRLFKRGLNKRNTDSLSNQQFYYIRISAINAELGEGPYSNIVQLKKINRGNCYN